MGKKLNKIVKSILDRTEELLNDLELEYNECLSSKMVSERAINITHEVLEKLRNALDQSMRKFWEKIISPLLSDKEREKAQVYFPIRDKGLDSFHRCLSNGKIQDLNTIHPQMYTFLLDLQPFKSSRNKWLSDLREIANKGKHINLIPQTRIETRRVNVSGSSGGSVSWDPSSVRFGSGVRIIGAPVNPNTQRIVPTPGTTEQIQIWVTFLLEGFNLNALGFCKESYEKVRDILEKMYKLF